MSHKFERDNRDRYGILRSFVSLFGENSLRIIITLSDCSSSEDERARERKKKHNDSTLYIKKIFFFPSFFLPLPILFIAFFLCPVETCINESEREREVTKEGKLTIMLRENV